MCKKSLFLICILLYCFNLSYGAENPDKGNVPADKKGNKYKSYEDFYDLYQPFLKNIKAYEPIYFLIGENPEKSKFQFSFCYQLFNKDAVLAQDHEWLQGLNFAFTQTSFWDLKSTSQPFEDSSYKPEIFWRSANFNVSRGDLKGTFLQSGLQHESNGQGGYASRSTNIVYLKPILMFYNEPSLIGLELAPKVWTYVANADDTNPDFNDYRGYLDLELKVGKEDSLVLASNFRPAKQGNSLQLDLTYPINKYFSNNVGIYLQVQYVNSLAENMLNYQERTEAVRLGVSLVR